MHKQLIYKTLKYFIPNKINSDYGREAEQFIEAMPYPVFWLDVHQRYQGCNKIFADLMELNDTSKIVGLMDTDLPFLEERIIERQEIFNQILTHEIAAGILYECMQGPDQKLIWIQKRFTPLKNNKDQVIGIFGAIIDISEQVNRRLKLEEDINHQHLLTKLIHDMNHTPVLSPEWGTLTQRSITLLKDITAAELVIWADMTATSVQSVCHLATDVFDHLTLFQHKEDLKLDLCQGYLDGHVFASLKTMCDDITSIFFYQLSSNDVPNYQDIILLINPDEERVKKASHIMGLIHHILHYGYIHKLLMIPKLQGVLTKISMEKS